MSAPVEALNKVPLFSNLDEKDLDQLARQMHERRFPEGAEVTTEGSTRRRLLRDRGGQCRRQHRRRAPARRSGPGDHFGEVALIDDGVRSASITAATDLLCYGLTPWEFRPFVEDHPQVAWALLETLARRARQQSADD